MESKRNWADAADDEELAPLDSSLVANNNNPNNNIDSNNNVSSSRRSDMYNPSGGGGGRGSGGREGGDGERWGHDQYDASQQRYGRGGGGGGGGGGGYGGRGYSDRRGGGGGHNDRGGGGGGYDRGSNDRGGGGYNDRGGGGYNDRGGGGGYDRGYGGGGGGFDRGYGGGGGGRFNDRGQDRRGGGGGGRFGGGRDSGNKYSERETGVLHTIKDSFGFIKCCDRNARLFMHFSELDRNFDERDLRVGSELEFVVCTDRQGKECAVQVAVLPANSVSFETVWEGRLKGRVVATLGFGKSGGHDYSTRWGDVGSVEGEDGSLFCFWQRDLESPRVTLRENDLVEFTVVVDKRSGEPRASKIAVVQRAEVPREKGIVKSVKGDFGFIDCADRLLELFVHFSQVQELSRGEGLRVNDEVEFCIATDRSGRQTATDVVLLPFGSVTFETVEEEQRAGTITRIVRSGGSVSFRPADAEEDKVIPFFDQQTVRRLHGAPRVGDSVTFFVATDKRTSKLRATNVAVTSCAEEERQLGIVVAVKPCFGFILTDAFEEVHFAFEECPPLPEGTEAAPQTDAAPGVESDVRLERTKKAPFAMGETVSFIMEQDGNGKTSARRVGPCPEGTAVSFSIVQEERLVGVVAREHFADDGHSRRGGGDEYEGLNVPKFPTKGDSGLIEVKVAEGERKRNVLFLGSDGPVDGLRVGDTVEFALEVAKGNAHKAKAVDITVLERAVEVRNLGIVCSVKDGFGFIDWKEKNNELYFSFGDVEGRADKVGTEVEFTVLEGKGKKRAVRLKVLPKGSVFEVLDAVYTGTIVQDRGRGPGTIEYTANEDKFADAGPAEASETSAPAQQASDAHGGTEGSTNEGGAAAAAQAVERINFGGRDLMDSRDTFSVGDAIQFQMKRDNRNNAVSAFAVSRRPELGIVTSVKSSVAFLRIEGTTSPFASQELMLQLASLPKDVSLELGDRCSAIVIVPSPDTTRTPPGGRRPPAGYERGGKPVLTRAALVEKGAVPPPEATGGGAEASPIRMSFGRGRGRGSAGAAVTPTPARRLPLGPDGTRGFSAGRGRVDSPGAAADSPCAGAVEDTPTSVDEIVDDQPPPAPTLAEM